MTEAETWHTARGPAADAGQAHPPWRVAAARAAGIDLPGWPAGQRVAALARLDDTGLPSGEEEDWRYTSLKSYLQRWSAYLGAAARPTGVDPQAAAGPPGWAHDAGGLHVQVVDGVARAPAGTLPPGLFIGSLGQLPRGRRTRAEELLRLSASRGPDSLVDLNSALAPDVLFVATDAGVNLDGSLLHICLQGSGAPAFGQPRILVDVADNSRLAVTVEHAGADGTLCNAVTEAWIARGGHLSLVRLQDLPDDGMLTDTSCIELAAGASAKISSVDLGSSLCRQSMTVVLAGTGAEATIDGLFLADGRRHIDTRTRLEHRAPGTTSREAFRGLADGHGRGIFNGKIIVMPGAAGSNAALTNRNLLLAATAEIDTKPELEIYVDDVRCSHGATTGQLDANALFYLRSRGLDPVTARQVLVAAFLAGSLGGIPAPGLRARLAARLQARLGGNVASPEEPA